MPLVYAFADGKADGNKDMHEVLGGKGANLAEMTNIGVPVPPGFTISALLCSDYLEKGSLSDDLKREMQAAMSELERATGRCFGSGPRALLIAVRSGAAVSMPGMMDTILNLGLNDETVQVLADESNNPQFAFDSYRRFIQMYGSVAFEINSGDNGGDPFEHALEQLKGARGVERAIDLEAKDLEALVNTFKSIVREHTGHPFPDDPEHQLLGAVEAVFRSWNSRRAGDYRRVHKIPNTLGTAVNIMAMVFGNLGEDSGTGVAFTRDPTTGANELFGEFLVNAQGEDVVAGIRTPEPLASMRDKLPQSFLIFRSSNDK